MQVKIIFSAGVNAYGGDLVAGCPGILHTGNAIPILPFEDQ